MREPRTLTDATAALRAAVTDSLDPAAQWLTPRRMVACLTVCFLVLLVIVISTGLPDPLVLGVVAWFAGRPWRELA